MISFQASRPLFSSTNPPFRPGVPFFSGLNPDEGVLSLSESFQAVQGQKEIHGCGNTDWGLLLSTRLDLLSFDVYGYLENLSLYPKELTNFLERGRILTWGLIPTSEEILKEEASNS